jgi:ferrous iron transport protein B
MATATEQSALRVALVGNPNTGKSTLFNALSGLRQRVGNFPGCTVETRIGKLRHDGHSYELIDLPGTYSLAPHSPDEMVAVDVLLGRDRDTPPPDAVIVIVDASNLERNLYLASQVLELERPTVLALNMLDVARQRGIEIDLETLSTRLGIPVVALQANRRVGLDALKNAVAKMAIQGGGARAAEDIFPPEFRAEVAALAELAGDGLPRYLVERLLLDSSGYLEDVLLDSDHRAASEQLAAARARLADAGIPAPAVEAMSRYGWVGRVLDGVVTRPATRTTTASDRFDRVLTHRLWGTLILAGLMLLVFSSVFRWAEPAMGAIEAGTEWLGGHVDAWLADGPLKSLLVDGVIAGVGGVIVFLPQIFILFFFVAALEDCGYLARAAYLMDKLMVRVGLSGKSFIPMLSSFACAIPGIMATRVIENRRDRLTTILVAPLMSCSARLPVYTLLIAAFIPDHRYAGGWLGLKGLTLFAMYTLGVVVAAGVAFALNRTLLKGETPPFVMELPSFKLPSLSTVVHRMLDRGWAFIRRAGTLILAVSILVWAVAYYPHDADELDPAVTSRLAAVETQLDSLDAKSDLRPGLEDEADALRNTIAGEYQRHSYLATAGHAIEPAVRPLGWDWRIGCAVIASFPAREVVVGTLGVIYNLGSDTDEESVALRDRLKDATWDDSDRKVYNVPVALSLMVFFALCAQCAATLVVIRRETQSWRWPSFTFAYMTVLAYIAALVTYQVGMRVL